MPAADNVSSKSSRTRRCWERSIYRSLASIYGFNLGLSEEVTESALTDYLHSQGGEVTRSSRLVGLTPQTDEVIAEIDHDGMRYQVNARWVVGCDGIHSATRELTGIEFEGHKYAKQWAVFDATVEGWNDTYEGIFAYHDLLPIILTAIPGTAGVFTSGQALTIRILSRMRQLRSCMYVPSASFVDVENPTRFNCFTKIAARFRSGRVFLAGDSAHLCSPSEGHGMNTGIQDAFNLAWKLALVYQGVVDESLLDSYEAERRPIAEAITKSGDVFEQAQMMTDPIEREKRDQAIRAMLSVRRSCISQRDGRDRTDHRLPGLTDLLPETPTMICLRGSASSSDRLRWSGPRRVTRLHQLAHCALGPHFFCCSRGPRRTRLNSQAFPCCNSELCRSSPMLNPAVALATCSETSAGANHLKPDAADRLGIKGLTPASDAPGWIYCLVISTMIILLPLSAISDSFRPARIMYPGRGLSSRPARSNLPQSKSCGPVEAAAW